MNLQILNMYIWIHIDKNIDKNIDTNFIYIDIQIHSEIARLIFLTFYAG